MNSRLLARLAPVVALTAGACFATRTDMRILQNDLQIMRAESAEQRNEATRTQLAQLEQVLSMLSTVNDSLRATKARLQRFQGDIRGELYDIRQQLIMIETLTGQGDQRLRQLKAELEEQRRQDPGVDVVAPPGAPPGDPGAPPSAPAPGPNQLYRAGVDQAARGSFAAARAAFQEVLTRYPDDEVAPLAQLRIGEAFAAERNSAAADSVYVLVYTEHAGRPPAATAMYKRAVSHYDARQFAETRTLLERLIREYPSSIEAPLARDLLRTIP